MIKVKYFPVTWLKFRTMRIALYKGEVLFKKFANCLPFSSMYVMRCLTDLGVIFSSSIRATIHMLVQAHLHVVLSSSQLMTNKNLSFPPGLVSIAYKSTHITL
jgi:hypothetical protein